MLQEIYYVLWIIDLCEDLDFESARRIS
jgi:hypothetical protein